MPETPPGEVTYLEAIRQALWEEMERDESVFCLGEDIGAYGGAFQITKGFAERFGEARVLDTPISESCIIGAATGASLLGFRPVVEMQFGDFISCGFDQVVNQAATLRYRYGGRQTVPIVIRCPCGAGVHGGLYHSQLPEAWFAHRPGLKVVAPATPYDAKGLLKAAIRDDNPVIFVEHETLYGARGEVPEDGDQLLRFGEAAIRREGTDVTIVAILRMAQTAQQAAKTLANEHGVEAEVIDPRTLRPLDLDTILDSVRKTNRAVIVEEGWPHGGVGANVAALIQEQAFDHLDAPVQRVTGADVPMPYAKRLEQAAIPHAEHVVSAALATLEGSI
jgi:pyruvate/2-oxoglutarate/acetoin dehydrogenase E1 component